MLPSSSVPLRKATYVVQMYKEEISLAAPGDLFGTDFKISQDYFSGPKLKHFTTQLLHSTLYEDSIIGLH